MHFSLTCCMHLPDTLLLPYVYPRSINGAAGVQHTTRGHIDLDFILDIQAYDVAQPPSLVVDSTAPHLDVVSPGMVAVWAGVGVGVDVGACVCKGRSRVTLCIAAAENTDGDDGASCARSECGGPGAVVSVYAG